MFPAIREFLREFLARISKKKKEEPLIITAKPVKVADIWSWDIGSRRTSMISSAAVHLAVLIFLFIVVGPSTVVRTVKSVVTIVAPLEPYEVKIPPGKAEAEAATGLLCPQARAARQKLLLGNLRHPWLIPDRTPSF